MNQIEVVFIGRNMKKIADRQIETSLNHLHLLLLHLEAGVKAACSSTQMKTENSNSICGLAPLRSCAWPSMHSSS